MLCTPAKPHDSVVQDHNKHLRSEECSNNEGDKDHNDLDQAEEEEEDPYNICADDIYDTVDANDPCNQLILNRPPAPIPRPEPEPEPEKPVTYISRGNVYFVFHFIKR